MRSSPAPAARNVINESLEPRRLLSRVELAVDLDAQTQSAFPDTSHQIIVAGDTAFCDPALSADFSTSGEELVRSDGTAAGTYVVKDITPGPVGSRIDTILPLGDLAIFTAADEGGSGTAMWRSDGTAQGTYQLLRSINGQTGAPSRAVLNGKMYFAGLGGLAVTDGTVGGTTLVAPFSQSVGNLTVANGAIYFTTGDSSTGRELWHTDGTAGGTSLLKDINPGSASSNPSQLTPVGSTVYFTADGGVDGTELWKTDGTAAGTQLVRNITAGASSSAIYALADYHGTLLFTGPGLSLWRSDGTAAGTSSITSLGQSVYQLLVAGDEAYFVRGTSYWQTDGTSAGTVPVASTFGNMTTTYVPEMAVLGTRLLFRGKGGGTGDELWITDGTAAGTMLVKDIAPGSASSAPWAMASNAAGTRAFFAADANDGTGMELFVTDGTPAGTSKVADVNKTSNGTKPHLLTRLGSQVLFFTSKGSAPGLYKTDGTQAGTSLVQAGLDSSMPPVVLDAKLYFINSDGELWVSDGTTQGTSAIPHPNVPGALHPQYLAPAGDDLYFTIRDATFLNWLYRLDGVTHAISAVESGLTTASAFAAPGDRIYFIIRSNGNESPGTLWRTIPGSNGAELVPDAPANITRVVAAGPGKLLIDSVDSYPLTTRHFLDALDTASGTFTRLVTTTASVSLHSTVDLGNGVAVFDYGRVYRTDFTAAGTEKLNANFSMWPGDLNAVPQVTAIASGGVAYFYGSDYSQPTSQQEAVFRTDGTPQGTQRLTGPVEITTTSMLCAADGRVYFQGSTGNADLELWETDGTVPGTQQVVDLVPGPLGSAPAYFCALGKTLLFNADDLGPAGSEIFKVNPDTQAPTVTGADFFADRATQQLEFRFDENVGPSLTGSDLLLTNTSTGSAVPGGTISVSYDRAANAAVFTFPGFGNPAGVLPDGNYRAILPAGSVADLSGNGLAGDAVVNFFVLAGDANRDRTVDTLDFNALAASFGGSNKLFSQGDFNYDGVVDTLDFNVLAASFGKTIAPDALIAAARPAPARASALRLSWALPGGNQATIGDLLFSDLPIEVTR